MFKKTHFKRNSFWKNYVQNLKKKNWINKFNQKQNKLIQVQSTNNIATRRLSYFFRQGKKAIREKILRDVIFTRSKKNNGIFSSEFFKSFFLEVTPFIGLKIRRRNKRGKSKIITLERIRGERKALGALSALVHSEGAVKKAFNQRLKIELEALYDSFVNNPKSNNLRIKRDEIHQLAHKSRPAKFKKKKSFLSSSVG